jgi:hypothetical protein
MRVYNHNNKKYISVTSVIDLMYPFNRKGFEGWARRSGYDPAWIMSRSSSVGRKVHGWVEDMHHGVFDLREPATDDTEQGLYYATLDFLEDWYIVDSEFVVYNDKWRYAGRVDMIIENDKGDRYYGDIKTWGAWRSSTKPPSSKKLKKVRNQLTMYKEADNGDIGIGVVHIKKDGYEFIELEEDYKWQKCMEEKQDKINSIIDL